MTISWPPRGPNCATPSASRRRRFSLVYRWPHAMPQYRVGHLDRVEAIERAVDRLPGLVLAGGGYRGVGISDCVRSGETAAARALGLEP